MIRFKRGVFLLLTEQVQVKMTKNSLSQLRCPMALVYALLSVLWHCIAYLRGEHYDAGASPGIDHSCR